MRSIEEIEVGEVKIPQVEYVDINLLKSDGKNPNKMSVKQEDALEKSMRQFGVFKPAVTNKNYVLADGEHGVKIARDRLGLKTYPVIRLDLDEVDRRILRQIANKLHGEHLPELDNEEFKFILENDRFEDFQDLLGERDLKLVQFLASVEKEGLGEDSLNIEESLAAPKYEVKRGQLWKLGDHLLLCGDSTNPVDVKRLMGEEKADMVFTDPPYGVDYSSKNEFLNESDGGKRSVEPIENDAIEDYASFFGDALKCLKPYLAEKNSFYLTISDQKLSELLAALRGLEFKFSQLLVWVKNNHVLGRQDYANKHELIVYGWLGTHKFYGGFDTTVWEVDKPVSSKLHPTMKPIELMEKAIKNSSEAGMIVLDVFGGSGSTLIACEKLNRKCRMMEIAPTYISVIIERWEKVTGKTAELVS